MTATYLDCGRHTSEVTRLVTRHAPGNTVPYYDRRALQLIDGLMWVGACLLRSRLQSVAYSPHPTSKRGKLRAWGGRPLFIVGRCMPVAFTSLMSWAPCCFSCSLRISVERFISLVSYESRARIFVLSDGGLGNRRNCYR